MNYLFINKVLIFIVVVKWLTTGNDVDVFSDDSDVILDINQAVVEPVSFNSEGFIHW